MYIHVYILSFFYLRNIMSHTPSCTDNAISSCPKKTATRGKEWGSTDTMLYEKIAQGLATACSKRKKPNAMSGADEPEKVALAILQHHMYMPMYAVHVCT